MAKIRGIFQKIVAMMAKNFSNIFKKILEIFCIQYFEKIKISKKLQ
jgi:hypothetical protein